MMKMYSDFMACSKFADPTRCDVSVYTFVNDLIYNDFESFPFTKIFIMKISFEIRSDEQKFDFYHSTTMLFVTREEKRRNI